MDHVLDLHFAAEAAHDLESLLATLTPDAEHDVVGQGVLVGHEAIAERYRMLFAQADEEKYEPLRRYHGENFVVDEVMATQLIANDDFGPQARGTVVSYRILHVCEFRDGLMSRENVWLDMAAIMAQIGAA
ncbi:nuclear transport factor 2 family protein [Kribbella sp. NPDC000426]|uniref:nuclear transport factor 2 family protein n=1 Tax=Kribbella sp. NPDC000426 TaxID=3154255 RepID=UPI00332FDE84